MRLEIYAIRDTMVGFMTPFYQANEQVALRNFKIRINNPTSELKAIAENLELYKLGTFDDQSGEISPLKRSVFMAKGNDVLEKKGGE